MRRALPTTAVRVAPRLELELSYASRSPWVPGPRLLSKWAGAALMPMKKRMVLSVRIVGKARSRSLNAHYRHKDKPTNVLSFAGAGNAPDGRYFLGELVIASREIQILDRLGFSDPYL